MTNDIKADFYRIKENIDAVEQAAQNPPVAAVSADVLQARFWAIEIFRCPDAYTASGNHSLPINDLSCGHILSRRKETMFYYTNPFQSIPEQLLPIRRWIFSGRYIQTPSVSPSGIIHGINSVRVLLHISVERDILRPFFRYVSLSVYAVRRYL